MTNLKVDNSKRFISPYLQFINSKGSGLFGALIHLADLLRERQEKARLSLPPHEKGTTRRLACQVQVLGDIEVIKFDGFWGQGSTVQ